VALTQRYEDIFKLLVSYKDDIERVTFWGVHDGYSWKNGFPVRGITNYPLLFNRDCSPKPAYQKLIDLVKN